MSRGSRCPLVFHGTKDGEPVHVLVTNLDDFVKALPSDFITYTDDEDWIGSCRKEEIIFSGVEED